MSTLWIREYKNVPRVSGASGASVPAVNAENVNIAHEPGVVDQTPVTFASSPVGESAAFNEATRYVTIIADAAFHYVVGEDPEDATTSALYVPAEVEKSFGVTPGHKISVVAAD